MGWAKYREDIASRQVADRYRRLATNNKPKPDARAKAPPSPPQNEKDKPKMSKLKEFTMTTARPLPVIVLADVSGSMDADGKISALNGAVAEMIDAFAGEDDARAEIHMSVVTFGGRNAAVHKPLCPAGDLEWQPMKAAGRTPMGEAFQLAQGMLEDREVIPSRAYRPALVLVSDGVPTDAWREHLKALLASDRASKATRFAMAIGADADRTTLEAFLDGNDTRVFEAHEAREIRKFFRWVTMSVTARSRSAAPNTVVPLEPTDLDDFDF